MGKLFKIQIVFPSTEIDGAVNVAKPLQNTTIPKIEIGSKSFKILNGYSTSGPDDASLKSGKTSCSTGIKKQQRIIAIIKNTEPRPALIR